MSANLSPRSGYDPSLRDARGAARAIRRRQAASQVRTAEMDSDTDDVVVEMEDDTMATGVAMSQVVRVALLQQELETRAPAVAGRLAYLAEDHAFGMQDALIRYRRRLHR